MELRDDVEVEGLDSLEERSKWLWSLPVGEPREDNADDELEVGLEQYQEEEAQARHLFSRRTHSREVPLDISPSGRVYQTVRRSRMEYSRPTMSIKSQWLHYSSSAKPLPQQPAPSLMSWTPIANYRPSLQRLTSSPSRKVEQKLIKRS